MRMAARNQFGHHDTFMAGLVRKPRRTRDIADGVKPGNASAAIFVGGHMGAVDLDAQRFQPQTFGIADDAHG